MADEGEQMDESDASAEMEQVLAMYRRRQIEQLTALLADTQGDGTLQQWAARLYRAGVRVRFTESKRHT